MIPIFEQGHGQGIGHSFDTFVNRFIEVCERKIREGNHHSFAFIFYDFNNNAIKDILRTQGGFTKLDRLASKNLSVFFLHSDNEETFRRFNDHFLDFFKLKGKHKIPFVLFFNLNDNNIQDIKVFELQQDNYLFAFNELYEIIEASINPKKDKNVNFSDNRFVKFTIYTAKILYTATLEYFLGKGYDRI
jgi:hypothetical protein